MQDNKDNLGLTEEVPGSETEAVEETGEIIDQPSDDIITAEDVIKEAQEETADVTAEETETIPAEIPVQTCSEETMDLPQEEEIKEETTDIAVIDTSVSEIQEEEKPRKKKKKGILKIFKGLGILLFVSFLAFSGFVGYKVWDYLQVYVYTTQHPSPVTFESETLSLTIDNIEIIDEIIGFEMDENYVYLGVKYTTENKTASPIEWKSFPLLSVREYVRDEEDTGYILVENTDQSYEMTGLRNYAIFLELDLRTAKDNLEAGESRTTADIFRIARTDYETKKYFLTTDLFNEIVTLPELPAVIIMDEATDTVTDTAE